jgi:predicted GNAT family acetyltransferase
MSNPAARHSPAEDPVRDDAARGRYELEVDGRVVFADHRRDGATDYILHVEAPVPLRGTGAAGRLMRGIMERARAEGLRVVPLCGYARSWIRRHKEYADLMD